MPLLLTAAPLSRPPLKTVSVPPLRISVGNALAAGADQLLAAETYRSADAGAAGTDDQLAAGSDCDGRSGAARICNFHSAAVDREPEQAAAKDEAATENLAGAAADEDGLGGAAAADVLLAARGYEHKVGQAGDDLVPAAFDHHNEGRAGGENDLRAAAVEGRGTGKSGGKHLLDAALADRRATLDAAARDDIDATDDHRADGAARPDKSCTAFAHGCPRGEAVGSNDQRSAAADRAGASARRQDLFGNPISDRTVEDEAGADFDLRAAAELRGDHDGIAPPFEHAAAAHDEAAHRPATEGDFVAAVLYGRGQRDAGGVHKLVPERQNGGAAREAGGAEYLLAAGHRCLQRRAGGDYLLEPSQMDGRADRQSGLQYKLVAVADRGTDSGAGGENLLSGTADYPRRSRGAAVVDRLCSPAQRGADGPGAGKNLLLAGAIYRGADCRTGKLKRLVATARDLGAGRLALDALKAFDFGADRRTAGTDKRKAAAADRRQAVDAGYDLLHAAGRSC
jgi:hypothetical protein